MSSVERSRGNPAGPDLGKYRGFAPVVGDKASKLDLALSILDWDWLYLKTGNGIFDGNTQLVVADAEAIEYGLIAALISVVIIASLVELGTALKNTFDSVAEDFSTTPRPSATTRRRRPMRGSG